jgi:hypothetical protein
MDAAQTSLRFEVAEPSIRTLNDMVRALLSNGDWWTPWEICEAIYRSRGIRVSDSSCTARLRDLRKPEFGGHVIELRRRAKSKAYEYHLSGTKQSKPMEMLNA